MNPIPAARPTIEEADILAVEAQLRTGHLEEGEAVRQFEAEVAALIGQPNAIAAVNGFAAINVLLVALGIGPGHEVVVPSYSCPAILYAVRQTGAAAVFADIGPRTFALDHESVARVISPRTRAIIVAYLFGFPAEIALLADAFPGIAIVEDIAQAFGVKHGGVPLGSRTPFAIASFYATKMVTSGDGGMVLTSDEAVAKRVRQLVYYGGRRGAQAHGFNYHMTNLNAALGLSQLGRLDAFIKRRRELAALYDAALRNLVVISRPFDLCEEAAYLRYPIVFPNRATRDLVKQRMEERGIACGFGVLEALHEKEGRDQHMPNTKRLTDGVLCLPIYPSLRDDEATQVAESLLAVVREL